MAHLEHPVVARRSRTGGGTERPAVALGPLRRGVREVGLGMITLGVIVLTFVLYQLFGTTLTEQRNQSRLAHAFASAVAAARGGHPATPSPAGSTTQSGGGGNDGATVGGAQTSVSPSVPSGTAVAHLVIPQIGLDQFVVQGTGEQQLSEGPGHYVGTPMPGQAGNAAIAGHRTTYGAPFFRLNELRVGSPIYVTVPTGQRYVYRVQSQSVVSPSDVAVLDPIPGNHLTLTTCTPRFTATSRLVVLAVLVGQPGRAAVPAAAATGPTTTAPATTAPATTAPAGTAPAATAPAATTTVAVPAARSATTRSATTLGSGNAAAWPPALLYGLGFLVLWVATRLAVNRARRWRRLGAFVVGVGLAAVPLWFCFENVVRLLPPSV